MIETLTDTISRELNLTSNNSDDYNDTHIDSHPFQSRLISRNISDNNAGDIQHEDLHRIPTNQYNNTFALPSVRASKSLFNSGDSDKDDTDGFVRMSGIISKHRLNTRNNDELPVLSRQPVQRLVKQSSRPAPVTPVQHRSSQKVQLTAKASLSNIQDDDDRDEHFSHNDAKRLRHILPAHRGNHGPHGVHSPALLQHSRPPAGILPKHPLRLIFIRHGERVNQALGSDWFKKAFRTNTYKPYDLRLPHILPKRHFNQAYEFDVPLTVHGLKAARLLGQTMINNNLTADICLSSPALRCIQTGERILKGMERRDRIPIRIEPGLFECPHLNHKLVDSFMSKKELMENGYNIKPEYKSLFPKVNVPESLDKYFERSATVMREIIDRYGPYGRTILIVTHAPGLLALTDAIKRTKPNIETFYRTVATYSTLAMYIAEYDGSKWKCSHQPFDLASNVD
ncbi:unnamed protein product [Rotaria magnacalcarata]|uniref:Uncharacterized protein n=2 Tax=Rotaria magnacalcarata TaxID=392030 RepID=A0A819YGQ4_9BILA|nr:unnamed protein product [Rotaria magnacalcarata]CAF4154826.1 unnamed protein product [Rotaria magnacalcarata]